MQDERQNQDITSRVEKQKLLVIRTETRREEATVNRPILCWHQFDSKNIESEVLSIS